MFIPVSTDAPLYHRPWVTILLIVANVAAFTSVGLGASNTVYGWDGWILEYGNGLHPHEWITSHFVHFGLFHLVGNMIFLWTFGMVVEGKLGWWRFLLLYLGIGLLGGFFAQLVMLGYDGFVVGAGGASLMVFALIAISLVWAPENEVDVAYFIFFRFIFRSGILHVPIYVMASLFIGKEILFWWLSSSSANGHSGAFMNTQAAHLLGAFLGLGAGVLMLKKGWVDCENWDLFSVWRGDHRRSSEFEPYYHRNAAFMTGGVASEDDSNAADNPDELHSSEESRASLLRKRRQFRMLLEDGRPDEAYALYLELQRISTEPVLSDNEHRALANGLYKSRSWPEAVEVMEEYIVRFSEHAEKLRVKLAALLVEIERRPGYALRVLSGIAEGALPEKYERERQKIERAATRMIDTDLLELQFKPRV